MKSTPQAARKLLRLFAYSLIAADCAGSFIYLRYVFSDEISSRRSAMNEAVFNAQEFFVSRQILLKSLVLTTVPEKKTSRAIASVDPDEEKSLSLDSGEGSWSLRLTRRMKDYLYENKVNLLYFPRTAGARLVPLFSSSAGLSEVPKEVIQRLADEDNKSFSVSDYLLLTDNTDLNSPLFLFTRLDDRTRRSGWLGIEVAVTDLLNELSNDTAGSFILLDNLGQIIFRNSIASRSDDSYHLKKAENYFGFVGVGLFPDRLAIRKKISYSGWEIIYSVSIRSLLPVLIWPLVWCVLFFLALYSSLRILISRTDSRLITPSEKRIQALIESDAFSRAILQIAPVALCVIRRTDGVVVLENSLSEQWLSNTEERESLCKSWLSSAFDNSSKLNGDEVETKDGRLLFFKFTPTRYDSQDVLVCGFSDITTRKQIEITLERAKQISDRANEAKTLFLATMSHEIRTPLYGVLGTLELLARTQLNDQQSNYLKAIERSSENLLQLICDVLDVSKIEAGQLQLELSTFSPLDLIEEVVQGYSGAAHAKGLQLFTLIDSTVPDWLLGDVTRLRQILNNLLNNALKFTDYGKIVLRLKIESRDDERVMLHCQVSDTGKGIAREEQSHLFEPFYQVESAKNIVAGTGLGLSICKRLMHLMNGTMRLVSEPGLGSSFTLQVPLVQVKKNIEQSLFGVLSPNIIFVVSPLRELAECYSSWLERWGARTQIGIPKQSYTYGDAVLLELHPGAARNLLEPSWNGRTVIACSEVSGLITVKGLCWQADINSLQEVNRALCKAQGRQIGSPIEAKIYGPECNLGLRILVAEDNVINQLILRDQLVELGCIVTLACDGAEVLALWREPQFDLVLTDVNMPRMNGYELAAQLRADKITKPIIGATANAMRDEGERCRNAGMSHCLIKPFTLQTLHQCLQQFCGRVQ
jgi:two-component system, NarL family, capsular synthesis sensor histidine kinase RcsC